MVLMPDREAIDHKIAPPSGLQSHDRIFPRLRAERSSDL